jgi:hypothetical protein
MFRAFLLGAVFLAACASTPRPEARIVSSEAAMRGAQEGGAGSVPAATLHLKYAQEERQIAMHELEEGHNHRASMMLARSEADSEVALALARAQTAKAGAIKAQESVDDLKQKQEDQP